MKSEPKNFFFSLIKVKLKKLFSIERPNTNRVFFLFLSTLPLMWFIIHRRRRVSSKNKIYFCYQLGNSSTGIQTPYVIPISSNIQVSVKKMLLTKIIDLNIPVIELFKKKNIWKFRKSLLDRHLIGNKKAEISYWNFYLNYWHCTEQI